jgi:hypothetical protein
MAVAGDIMASTSGVRFGNIESAHEYVTLLCEALDEAKTTIADELSAPSALTGARHIDALRLVDYKLHALRQHLLTSRRLLSDLRTLRRYLQDERASERALTEDARQISFGSDNSVSDRGVCRD